MNPAPCLGSGAAQAGRPKSPATSVGSTAQAFIAGQWPFSLSAQPREVPAGADAGDQRVNRRIGEIGEDLLAAVVCT